MAHLKTPKQIAQENKQLFIAYENDYSIENPKRHFSRAYCKYLIAINQPSEKVKEKLFNKAEQIIGRVLCYKSDNASCLWLQSELLKA